MHSLIFCGHGLLLPDLMEGYSWNFSIPFIIFFLPASLFLLIIRRRSNFAQKHHGPLPPGPPGWPIIGNMLDLGTMPHRTLTELSHKFGPVLWLRLGVKNTMVIQSAKAATEFFKKHDLSFAERTVYEASRVHDYHKGSLALAPYGSHWRMLRRLVTVDMLVNKRINDTASVRRKCVNDMQLWIEEEASKLKKHGSNGVQVAHFVFLMTFNLLGNLMLSRDLVGPRSKEDFEFFEVMSGLMAKGGGAFMADFIPWLWWFDPQGLMRKMKRDLGKAIEIASKFVKDRMKERQVSGGVKTRDFLDALLQFEGSGNDEPAKICDRDLNIFILEIFMAGSETTSSTIEWAMTELLCNQETLTRAKAELTQVIGPNRKIEENDIDKLPYMQGVIKETLRLHPPVPFLVPRRAMHDTNFMGYFVPKDTQVFVNAYAIGRDPDVWDDPLVFKPERFIGSKTDYKGQHYELIPFGAGRRMCVGVPLAHRMLHLTLGMLLHQFDWALDGNVTSSTMDWKDTLGVTLRKSKPLLAVPTKCL